MKSPTICRKHAESPWKTSFGSNWEKIQFANRRYKVAAKTFENVDPVYPGQSAMLTTLGFIMGL
jgi:hypothetical protein